MLLSSFGVNGLRIERLRGNRWLVLVDEVLVFDPYPKIGKFKMFRYECDSIRNRFL